MNRLCIHKATKKIIEMQSGGDGLPDLMESRLNILKLNAINAGYKESDIEVKWVTDAEYAEAIEQDPVTIASKQKAQLDQQKKADADLEISSVRTKHKGKKIAGMKSSELAELVGAMAISMGWTNSSGEVE